MSEATENRPNQAQAEALSAPTEPVAAEATPQPSTPPQTEPAPTAEELQNLREQAAKAEHHWELYLRARAELDNFRKRATRERQDAVRFASQSLIEKLLPVLDSFDMAMTAVNNPSQGSLEALRQGLILVHTQLKNTLGEAGVQEVVATGQSFDPNLHEAVGHEDSNTVPEGQVLQQLRKGYRLHDRLIRPATVIVAKAPAATPAREAAES
jgi:molecular chaperone GrpE